MKQFGHGGLNPEVDADELLESIGLSEDEIRWRKDHVDFGEEDAERLAALESTFRNHRDDIADRFYEKLTQSDRTLEVFGRSPKGIEQLKQTQRAYIVTLGAGEYDEEYFQNRARIGKLHDLLEMPLNYYIGQYGVYYALLLEVLDERMQENVIDAIRKWTAEEVQGDERGMGKRLLGALGGTANEADADDVSTSLEETVRDEIHDGMCDLLAVLRILNLDMQVAVDTYVDSYSGQLEASIDRREQLAQDVQQDVWSPLRDLNTAAGEIADSAERINVQADDSAVEIAEIADEVATLGAATEEIASTAGSAQRKAHRVQTTARRGRTDADRAITEVTEVAHEVAEEIEELDRSIGDVDDTLDLVDEITGRTRQIGREATLQSTQTTRDPEKLREFADEVKTFATETERQLDAIRERVESIHEPIEAPAERAAASIDEMESGAERIKSCVDTLAEIVETVDEATGSIDEIATATDTQAESAERVAAAADEAAGEIEEISGEIGSVAAATEEQKAQLVQIVQTIKQLTDGQTDDRKRTAV